MASSDSIRRGWHRAAWPIAEQFASPVALLFLSPLLYERLGIQQFGVWALAQTVLLAAAVLSFGRSSALLVVLPQRRRPAVHQLIQPLTTRIGLLVLKSSTGIAIALTLTLLLCFEKAPASVPTLLAALLVLAWTAFSELENTATAALKGLNAFRESAMVELFGRMSQVGATWLLVGPGSSVLFVVSIAIGVTAGKLALKLWLIRRHPCVKEERELVPARLSAVAAQVRTVGTWGLINAGCGLVFYSTDRWAIGYLHGASTVAAYAVCAQLAQLGHVLAAAAAQPLIPWAAANAKGELGSQARRSIGRVAFIATLLSCIAPLAMIFFAGPLLAHWISPAFAHEHSSTARQLGTVFLLLCANVPSFQLLVGLGDLRFVTGVTVTSSIAFAAGCAIGVPESVSDIVMLKGLFALISLSVVVRLWWLLCGAPRPNCNGDV